MVLDCIDSSSLPPFLLLLRLGAAMALLRLHGYRDSSEPLLFSGATSTKISCNMAHQCRFLMKIFFSSVFWFFTSQSAFFQSCCDRSSWDDTSNKQGIMSCSRTPENLTPQKCPGTFPNILSTNLLPLLRDAKYL